MFSERKTVTEIDCEADGAVLILDTILRKWKGSDASREMLRTMRVLDLASGSGDSHTIFTTWYPHFSRLCATHGADVVAIDINPQKGDDKTMFTWAQADLVDVVLNQGLQNLQILKERKFDLIHSANFVGRNYYPELLFQLNERGVTMKRFEDNFLEQAGALLAEDGVMTIDTQDPCALSSFQSIFYTKKQDAIIPLI